MKYQLIKKTEAFSSAFTARSAVYAVGDAGCDSFSCVAVIDVDTPDAVVVASADIDFETNTWESVAHGLSDGLKVRLTTSDTLPDPLLVATDYFVIVVDEDNFKLAASLADAQAGTAITLVDAGVGDQTVTPTALAGANIKFQQSNDGVTWVDIGSATNITVDANVFLEKDRPTTGYISVLITLTAGHISADLQILGKGDKAG
jgi:hypothetical protein